MRGRPPQSGGHMSDNQRQRARGSLCISLQLHICPIAHRLAHCRGSLRPAVRDVLGFAHPAADSGGGISPSTGIDVFKRDKENPSLQMSIHSIDFHAGLEARPGPSSPGHRTTRW